MASIDDQLQELKEVVYKTKATVDRLEANWDKDRTDFSEFKNRLGHQEVELKTLAEVVRDLPKQTSDKMNGVVGKIKDEANDLKEVITEKKMIAVNGVHKPKKRHWYTLFLIKT